MKREAAAAADCAPWYLPPSVAPTAQAAAAAALPPA